MKYPVKPIPITTPSGRIRYLLAGPTRDLPDHCMLVRCAEEITVPFDRVAFDVATEDFTPFDEDKLLDAVPEIFNWLEDEDTPDLYVGCMGGIGRTGTLLSILVAQHPDMTPDLAIKYIRAIYNSHAVETAAQREQVSRMAHITPLDLVQELSWQDEPGGPEQPLDEYREYSSAIGGPRSDRLPWWRRLFNWG